MQSSFIVAENDIHCYPILWRHPVHRVLGPIGLNWLFLFLFPLRDFTNKNINFVSNRYGMIDVNHLDDENGKNISLEIGDKNENKIQNNNNETPDKTIKNQKSNDDSNVKYLRNVRNVHSKAAMNAILELANHILSIEESWA